MSNNVSASTINELFLQKLNSEDGLQKVAQEGSAFIRQKLREVSFARKIMNPQYVTKADLQRSVNHDGLVKIVDIEPDSKAMAVNFRGESDWNYVTGDRFEIPFYMISSEDFQKTEEELLAYDMPLTEVIEKNSVLDIQKIEDSKFITAAAAASTAASNDVTGGDDSGKISKTKLKTTFDKLDANSLRSETILMSSTTFNRLFLYDSTTVGDAVGSEMSVNGYTYSTLFGRKLVVTNKADLLGGASEKMYVFAGQDFLGQFNILNDVKFWIEKKKNIISWAAYESIGMGIGNQKAVASLAM